jgi:hypothetical protein
MWERDEFCTEGLRGDVFGPIELATSGLYLIIVNLSCIQRPALMQPVSELSVFSRHMRWNFILIEGPRSRCYGRIATLKAYCATLWWRWWGFFCFSILMEHLGMKLTGKNRGTRRKTCPSATLSTTNPTCTDPGLNPGLRGERPATNRVSQTTNENTQTRDTNDKLHHVIYSMNNNNNNNNNLFQVVCVILVTSNRLARGLVEVPSVWAACIAFTLLLVDINIYLLPCVSNCVPKLLTRAVLVQRHRYPLSSRFGWVLKPV